MTPKKFNIRTLPDWAQCLFKSQKNIISNYKRMLEEQEIKYETLLRSMKNGHSGNNG